MISLRKSAVALLATAGLGLAATGDSACSDLMCVSANVNNDNTVTYVLQSTGKMEVGWMAIGFGKHMFDSAMVIMWPNDDMSVTLSQRKTPTEMMPLLDPSPPRIATYDASNSAPEDCLNPKLSFTIPANTDTVQTLIWAFSDAPVDSSAQDAMIHGHIGMGQWTLNLQNNNATLNPANANADTPIPTQTYSTSSSVSSTAPAASSTSSSAALASTSTTTSTAAVSTSTAPTSTVSTTSTVSAGSPSQTGAATSLLSMGKNALIAGALSAAAFAALF